MKKQFFAVTALSSFVLATGSLTTDSLVLAQLPQVSSDTAASGTTTFTVTTGQASGSLDYLNAKTLTPTVSSFPGGSSQPASVVPSKVKVTGAPGSQLGSPPNPQVPKLATTHVTSALDVSSTNATVLPENYGTSSHPFSTARNPQTTGYPYSPSGRLFFTINGSTYVCSASVIQRGVVVTAAHCVANFGSNKFYSNWQFIPAYNNGAAPYGTWTVSKAIVPTSYLNGTNHCIVSGVICDDDVAVLVMNPVNGYNVGDYTGWYGVAYGGYGYSSFLGKTLVQLTQIGYPVSLDNGVLQQRNDSLTYLDSGSSNQQLIGSLMTGGSSGGPWLMNYGQNPNIASPNTPGQSWTATPLVTGVTSWGYNDPTIKEQGASVFTATNIGSLYTTACTNTAQLACK